MNIHLKLQLLLGFINMYVYKINDIETCDTVEIVTILMNTFKNVC